MLKAEGVSVADRYHDGLQSLLNAIDRLFGQTSEAQFLAVLLIDGLGVSHGQHCPMKGFLILHLFIQSVFLIVGATIISE